jgi:hypothetical protein
MIKAVLLLIHSVATWDRIVEARRGMAAILFIHLLPLLLLTSAGEFYGLTHWGKQRAEYGKPTVVEPAAALRYETFKAALALAVIFLAAQIIKAVGQSFHTRHNYPQAFTVVAYSLSPLFLTQLLQGTPFMPAWVVWAVGIALTASALYQGVPRVMQPDPPQTIGLYFMSVLTLTGLTALAQFLSGKFLAAQINAAAQTGIILPHLK